MISTSTDVTTTSVPTIQEAEFTFVVWLIFSPCTFPTCWRIFVITQLNVVEAFADYLLSKVVYFSMIMEGMMIWRTQIHNTNTYDLM